MIDMGAVLGGRATVGKNCHVGAGAVVAGCPARVIKVKNEKTAGKTALVDALRAL